MFSISLFPVSLDNARVVLSLIAFLIIWLAIVYSFTRLRGGISLNSKFSKDYGTDVWSRVVPKLFSSVYTARLL